MALANAVTLPFGPPENYGDPVDPPGPGTLWIADGTESGATAGDLVVVLEDGTLNAYAPRP